jgi:hypothetical protein
MDARPSEVRGRHPEACLCVRILTPQGQAIGYEVETLTVPPFPQCCLPSSFCYYCLRATSRPDTIFPHFSYRSWKPFPHLRRINATFTSRLKDRPGCAKHATRRLFSSSQKLMRERLPAPIWLCCTCYRIINPATKSVIPAAAERIAGIQKRLCDYWIPAFARMTRWRVSVALFNCQFNH